MADEASTLAVQAAQESANRRASRKGKGKEVDPTYAEAGWAGPDPMLQNIGQLQLAARAYTETEVPFSIPKPVSRTSTKRKSAAAGNPERNHRKLLDSSQQLAEYVSLRISDEEAVASFYLTRFRQMQQLMCKLIAKNWIKVIEPKKQTNYPYNRGDTSKPSWWPKDVRHKEPDHLMKPGTFSSSE